MNAMIFKLCFLQVHSVDGALAAANTAAKNAARLKVPDQKDINMPHPMYQEQMLQQVLQQQNSHPDHLRPIVINKEVSIEGFIRSPSESDTLLQSTHIKKSNS